MTTSKPLVGRLESPRPAFVPEMLTHMRLPKAYWEASLDKVLPTDSAHYKAVAEFVHRADEMVRMGVGLLLWGPNDQGKTGCAAVCLKAARQAGHSCLFARAERLRTAELSPRETFDGNITLVQRARRVGCLVIDDLGKEHRGESGFAHRFIEDLVRDRISEKLSTFITTNMNPKKGDLEKAYSKSFEHVVRSVIYPVPVIGHNYREGQAQETAALFRGDE